jgi:hypothetical protein
MHRLLSAMRETEERDVDERREPKAEAGTPSGGDPEHNNFVVAAQHPPPPTSLRDSGALEEEEELEDDDEEGDLEEPPSKAPRHPASYDGRRSRPGGGGSGAYGADVQDEFSSWENGGGGGSGGRFQAHRYQHPHPHQSPPPQHPHQHQHQHQHQQHQHQQHQHQHQQRATSPPAARPHPHPHPQAHYQHRPPDAGGKALGPLLAAIEAMSPPPPVAQPAELEAARDDMLLHFSRLVKQGIVEREKVLSVL